MTFLNINVYDFDKTIYDGDSSVDFFKFCLTKNFKCILIIPNFILNYFLYLFRIRNKTEVKESFFVFLKYFDDIETIIDEFWNKYNIKIKKFYLEKDHTNDIIISASPKFLLKKITKQLKVKDLIASEVDSKTGKFKGRNCKGQEKVEQLLKKYSNIKIIQMYTDSYSDQPLIDLAEKAYLVKKNKIISIK